MQKSIGPGRRISWPAIAGVIICLAAIACMLLSAKDAAPDYTGAQLVQEVNCRAKT